MTTDVLSFFHCHYAKFRQRLRRLSYPTLMALTILGLSNQSLALPNLLADKRIDSIPVKIGGMEEAFTVIQDARDPKQWYYVPDRPRLFERTVGKKTEPDFTLIRYQYKNPKKPSELLEGGLLQFAVSLAIPPKALKQLAKAIAQHERSVSQTQSTGPESLSTEIRSKVFQKESDAISQQSGDLETTNQHNKLQQPMDVLDEKAIRLSALPLNSAQVALYIPEQAKQDKQEATFLASAPLGGGIAPMFATQKMVFSVHLKKQGADLYDTLVNTNTGLPIVVTMKFSALTPPAGFKVTVDWDRLYAYYSEHEKFRAASTLSLSDWNIWDVSSHLEKEELLDVLISNKLINIEVIEGTGFDLTKIQPYIDSILQRINKELLAEFKPPEKIQLANLDKSKSDKKEQSDDKGEKSDEESKKSELDKDKDYLISAHDAVAMKNRAQVKRGKETIHFNVMTHVESTTIAGGFIGIGHYPKELRERLVTTVKPGPWESAFFVLPVVADAKKIGISQVDFQVALLHKKKKFDAQLLKWTPDNDNDNNWRDRNNLSRNTIAFPLAHFYHRLGKENIEQLNFQTQTQITSGRDVLKVTQVIPMITGEVPIATPLSAVDVLEVDGDTLNWRRVDKEATLTQVSVAVKSGQRYFNRTMRPRRLEREWLRPKPLYWLLPANSEEPIKAEIRYWYKRPHHTQVDWAYNGQNIRKAFPSLQIKLKEPKFVKEKLEIDGEKLEWYRVTNGKLKSVNIYLESGKHSFKAKLKPHKIEGKWEAPKPVDWFLPANSEEAITAKIRYWYKRPHHKQVDWAYNGQNIRKAFPSLKITLNEPKFVEEKLEIDGEELEWYQVTDGKLKSVKIYLKSGKHTFKAKLKPSKIEDDWEAPKPVYWFLPTESKLPISAKIRYRYKRSNNKTVVRKYEDIRQKFPSLSITLDEPVEEKLEINGEELEWYRVTDSKLKSVIIYLESGKHSFKAKLKPRKIEGEWEAPKPVYWFLPTESKLPISAKIRYRYKRSNNKTVVRKYEDIREIFPELFIELDDLLEEGEDE